MKNLFTTKGKYIYIVDEVRKIVEIDHEFYDLNGNSVPGEETFYDEYYEKNDEDRWTYEFIENEGIEEKLISESTIEPVWEIDDAFGNYGFKNKQGEFVIEPQYAFAWEFTCGLACVNLNRTWYKAEDGRRYYENHFGYINNRGETVIPFQYCDAEPFNKYGIAVVDDKKHNFLIDVNGSIIPGTENLVFGRYHDYDSRYFECSYYDESDYFDHDNVGIYDTKERKLLLEPSIQHFTEWEDNLISISKQGMSNYFINSGGEIVYPWFYDNNDFDDANVPNKNTMNAIVSKYIFKDCSEYQHEVKRGLYSPKKEFILPIEYDQILEISDDIYGLVKNGIVSVIRLEEGDY